MIDRVGAAGGHRARAFAGGADGGGDRAVVDLPAGAAAGHRVLLMAGAY
ncbi:hypothetical protein AZ78_3954 [Lysobacter capsici AZ78]|uniref:Uncharacterized protein n=1 Tax=Lysobacter capsici AZ78 TaxID=1444315 RepID=A0A125MNF4_9GAMM|nr:hypothetical protein AZ78_3954 [Lysobacter capsici AZ78]